MKCNKCGSGNITKAGGKVKVGGIRQRYRCLDCGTSMLGEYVGCCE